MKYLHTFLILLFAISALATVSERSFAQSDCHNKILRIPICSGFYLHLDTSSAQRINTLRKSADSLNKEAEHLEDSLSQGSLENNLPDEFLELNTEPKPTPGGIPSLPNNIWDFRGKTNGVFPLPNVEQFKEKNWAPIPNFKGWYYEKLADIAE